MVTCPPVYKTRSRFRGSLMAGAVLASVPIVAVYVWFLDSYVSGLTAGAVKG